MLYGLPSLFLTRPFYHRVIFTSKQLWVTWMLWCSLCFIKVISCRLFHVLMTSVGNCKCVCCLNKCPIHFEMMCAFECIKTWLKPKTIIMNRNSAIIKHLYKTLSLCPYRVVFVVVSSVYVLCGTCCHNALNLT